MLEKHGEARLCASVTRVLLSRVTQAGAQQLLVHSENIFCAAKYLVPLAGSDLDAAVRKKQQEASATSHRAPGFSPEQKIPTRLSSCSLIPMFGRDVEHPVSTDLR